MSNKYLKIVLATFWGLIFTITTVSFVCSQHQPDEPSIGLLLKPSIRKKEPLLGEIEALIVIKNIGSEKIRIWRRIDIVPGSANRGGIILEYKIGENPEIFRRNGALRIRYSRLPKKRDSKIIRPKSCWKIRRNINRYHEFDQPGTYQVRAILSIEDDYRAKVSAIPPVYSNWITITVKE